MGFHTNKVNLTAPWCATFVAVYWTSYAVMRQTQFTSGSGRLEGFLLVSVVQLTK